MSEATATTYPSCTVNNRVPGHHLMRRHRVRVLWLDPVCGLRACPFFSSRFEGRRAAGEFPAGYSELNARRRSGRSSHRPGRCPGEDSPWRHGGCMETDLEDAPHGHSPPCILRGLHASVVNWYLQSRAGGRPRLIREQAYCVGLEGLLELRSPQPDRPAGSCCRAER